MTEPLFSLLCGIGAQVKGVKFDVKPPGPGVFVADIGPPDWSSWEKIDSYLAGNESLRKVEIVLWPKMETPDWFEVVRSTCWVVFHVSKPTKLLFSSPKQFSIQQATVSGRS